MLGHRDAAGDDHPLQEAAQILTSRTAQNRTIKLRPILVPEDTAGCHVIFVPLSKPITATDLEAYKNKPVLTVREESSAGIIQLFLVDNQLRFSVDDVLLASSGLKLSSQVLKLSVER